ncbi:zinc-binding dehydrogenase family protein [Mycolicibacterium hassiacum DSM 44199]|uniref:Zinc-binding dehydrogenase family protein n=1 Tax=Mycolicibacterium hassiacum (strain DSM 44199 / CIP 105218 / JCM 12690 / 3849) TaxID=1122247 RepID=K5BKC5_MYCHD|nr:zinc-binding dehydrogenase [Mycolicibacterium hassiacum]EKF24624.1 zinc-binding dehydrogenase family protein [Mycolicibacterium hassiacum DSM 44199]
MRADDGLRGDGGGGRAAAGPPQPQVYPLERAAEAIAAIENRTAKGKIVVKLR